ncbi:amidase [Salinisphaera sp. Q1T1-3]|uniref:amidase n=1 Tax=Salinisphaera sp. Q1T1-3 TaxID=2321229 RepID=UPI000E751CC1|nr:amidase [Salinisphaera sp. Q1T1-3]RJS93271.1 amidase [Salinisphaera sp. Q1T1-3]
MRDHDTDLGNMDAGALTRLYASGEASPLEATRAALDRIDRFNEAVNAYVHVDREGAEKAAKASARRWGRGEQRSPIDGVPVSLKDLTSCAGMPCREGSATTSDAYCDFDGPPVTRLREAGAVLLGKTNTPEFGWKAVTDNRLFGATCNPWDTRLTSGGSSGGAAAAAALNMGVLHQGGDSGGSIRIPSSFCGVFGFMPTFGWTPQWPPAKMTTLSSIGPIVRHPRDAARMLNVIGRYDYRDPYAVHGQPDDWGVDLDCDLRGLRIAYSADLGYASVNDEIATRVREAATNLEKLGAEVIEVHPGFESPIDIFRRLWFTASLEVYSQCDERGKALLDPGLVDDARKAEHWQAIDLFRAYADRADLTAKLEHFNQEYHLLMTPSVPIEPFEINHEVPPGVGMHDWEEWAQFSYPLNLANQPAASIPCGFTRSGLPIGFQLAGGRFDDVRVLRAANAYLDAYPARFPTVPNPAEFA